MTSEESLRWRLILGRYAQHHLAPDMTRRQVRMERALDFLYGREYQGRGVRGRDGEPGRKGPGSLDGTQLNVPQWLNEVRQLFPKQTFETLERHALDRYELTELINNPQTLEQLEPNYDLLKMMLTLKGHMKKEVLDTARQLIRTIVEELRHKLAQEVKLALNGRINRFRSSPLKVMQNFDWRGTIRQNLKNYDPERQQLVLSRVKFFSRLQRHLPWQIILCVDQSGSMVDSVIHSAVLAGILAGLPAVTVKLVVFDTSLVDLSAQVDDPVEILMSVQLGGGTDIGQALTYCEQLVENPRRTVLALITDFGEGAPPNRLYSATKRLVESGVTLLGLAALDGEAAPDFDQHIAGKLASLGMEITAATPKEFAQWLIQKMSF
ncbi:MAG: VWA domain-containing protein [Acidobacteria bacterium]|nr:VWA domain-containing protein [Acidobacteriota bacterium]MCB9396256.1 VWA domain-containing protein [Acidobacteriota bacterium]